MLNFKLYGLVGCIAATSFTAFYFLRNRKSKKINTQNLLCPGLINTGNSCFLNSLLQALAPSTYFKQWLCKNRCQEKPFGSLQNALSLTIKVLNMDSVEYQEKYFNPKIVVEALTLHGWQITSEQKDTYEYFNILMQALEEDYLTDKNNDSLFCLKKNTKNLNVYSMIDLCHKHSKNTCRIGECDQILRTPTIVDSPFKGTLITQLQGRICNHKLPMKQEIFSSLTLTLPSKYHELLNLDLLLRRYFTIEQIDDFECDFCQTKQSFIKRSWIGKMPRSLCLHIQRSLWSDLTGTAVKNYQAISFSEFLTLQPYSLINNLCTNKLCNKKSNDVPLPLVGGNLNIWSLNSNSYSSPGLCRLKALNYLSQSTLLALLPDSTPPDIRPPSPLPSNSDLQAWSSAYYREARPRLAPKQALYRLVSVVSHLGDATSGHFVAYRRAPERSGIRFPQRWVATSDCSVAKATMNEVMAVSPYMLFYDRFS